MAQLHFLFVYSRYPPRVISDGAIPLLAAPFANRKDITPLAGWD
jgi:hypothetical protein